MNYGIATQDLIDLVTGPKKIQILFSYSNKDYISYLDGIGFTDFEIIDIKNDKIERCSVYTDHYKNKILCFGAWSYDVFRPMNLKEDTIIIRHSRSCKNLNASLGFKITLLEDIDEVQLKLLLETGELDL